MACPNCGVRYYVIGSFVVAPAPIDQWRAHYEAKQVELEATTHAHELTLGGGPPFGPVCGKQGASFVTRPPGYFAPLGPDEARMLVSCEDCRAAIAPARGART